MKIAILTDPVYAHLHAHQSGRGDGQAATWLTQVAHEFLAQDAFEISWLSLKRGLRHRMQESIGVHQFIELPQFPSSLDSHIGYAISRYQLLRELKKIQPDVTHTWGTERPYPAVLKNLRSASVLSINGVLQAYAKLGALSDSDYWRRQVALEGQWLPHATVVTTESDWASSRLEPLPPAARIRKIVYGVNPSFYQVPWQPQAASPSIVYVGTISKGKGSDILIDAVESISDRNFTLHMVGQADVLDPLKARNTPGVVWHGQLGWQELQKLLQSAWCLVHPTLADSNPNAVKEARVIGLPIITTRHGGQAEYLVDDGNALLIDPLNLPSLAKAISKMTSSIDLCQKMGSFQHEENRERFLPKHTANAFMDAYQAAYDLNREKTR